MKKSFTLIELILSIVIGSIVLLFGITIMKQVFDTQLKIKEYTKLLNRTNNVILLLEKNIQNAVLNSVIVWKCNAQNNDCYNGNTNGFKSIQEVSSTEIKYYPVMEFLQREPYSLEGKWNGSKIKTNINFIDLRDSKLINSNTSEYNISIIDENLSEIANIIGEYNKYYTGTYNDPFANQDTVLLMSGSNGKGALDNIYNSYGYSNSKATSTNNKLFKINSYTLYSNKTIANIIPITSNNQTTIFEKFYFINSNIAIVPKYNSSTQLYDLYLVHNFRSWKGQQYKDGKYELIAKNVSNYSFKMTNGYMHIYLCLSNPFIKLASGNYLNVCKEKYILNY